MKHTASDSKVVWVISVGYFNGIGEENYIVMGCHWLHCVLYAEPRLMSKRSGTGEEEEAASLLLLYTVG